MAFGKKDKTSEARKKLRNLEKRFDLKGLEKQLDRFDAKDLDKVLDRFDWKDLEKKLEKDVSRRAKELRQLRGHEEKSSGGTAGFFAGLLIGAIVGVVLALLFGKQNEQSAMDQFVSGSGGGTSPYGGSGTTMGSGLTTPTSPDFGDDAAIEREVHTSGDMVSDASDAVDSASDDVRAAAEDADRPSGNL